jgi:uncharacterized membrane protein YdjX (TVP38/TMEM64 family)
MMQRNPIDLVITKKEVITQALQLVVIMAAVLLLIRVIGPDTINVHLERLGVWGPLLVVLMKASTIVFAPLGGSPLYIFAGAAYGFWPGFFYTMLGDAIGFSTSFFLSRKFGTPILKYFLGSDAAIVPSLLGYLETKKGLLQARLFCLAFPEAVSYAAGLTGISFFSFFLIQLGVSVIPVALLVGFGEALLARMSPLFLFSVSTVVGLVALVGMWWFYRIARQHAKNKIHE